MFARRDRIGVAINRLESGKIRLRRKDTSRSLSLDPAGAVHFAERETVSAAEPHAGSLLTTCVF